MAELSEMSASECAGHLSRGVVGRLAFITPNGLRMVPMNYRVNGDTIVFRTSADSELGLFGDGVEAVFEIDEVDHEKDQVWSVLAFGQLVRPSPYVEPSWDIHGWQNPTPWVDETRNFHMELPWTRLTGRRLALHTA